jgi:CheY-like chemotaxis protein
MSQQPVLVVEDEPDGQELVSRMLSQVDMAVDLADDAEKAWPLLLSKHYTAVVIDLALPGMDGFQLLRAIREKPELDGVRCVAITAFHTPELKQQALQEGFNGYFAKPLERTRFLSALEEMVSKS